MFRPGHDLVHVAGQVFDNAERYALAAVAGFEDFSNGGTSYLAEEPLQALQLTAGRRHAELECQLAKRFKVRHAILVNSGSSANLLAFQALGLVPGSKVATVACAFPTTVAPIVQAGCIPVFVDVGSDGNVDVGALDSLLTDHAHIKAIVLAHALGFPFDLDEVRVMATSQHIPLLADCCDAAGAQWRGLQVTSLADVATLSFYPAHHMTTGEGGCVLTDREDIAAAVRSLRDWGRDCTCPPGHDNTCGRRFSQRHGTLPVGYDHKYVYTRLGYNLKMTEPQAAVGLVQLGKLDRFIERRRATWAYYRDSLDDLGDVLDFTDVAPEANASPFGFLVTVRRGAPFTRGELIARLEARKIQTRPLFAGNLIRHPCMTDVHFDVHHDADGLPGTEALAERAFWLGVYPGVTDEMREWVIHSLRTECHR